LALTPGPRIGVYEVTMQIDDVMGEAYRATDTNSEALGGYQSAARLGGGRCGSPLIELAAQGRQ
jgi:hypothetical protein